MRIEAQQVVQPLEGFPVAPLQVVEEEQQGLACSQDGSCQGLKQTLPLPCLGEWAGGSQFWPLHQEVWHTPGYFCQPDIGQPGESASEWVCTEPGRDGPIGKLAFGGVTACICAGHALPTDPGEQLFRQSRFPDTCFAGQHHHLRSSSAYTLPGFLQLCPLGSSANQWRTCH